MKNDCLRIVVLLIHSYAEKPAAKYELNLKHIRRVIISKVNMGEKKYSTMYRIMDSQGLGLFSEVSSSARETILLRKYYTRLRTSSIFW